MKFRRRTIRLISLLILDSSHWLHNQRVKKPWMTHVMWILHKSLDIWALQMVHHSKYTAARLPHLTLKMCCKTSDCFCTLTQHWNWIPLPRKSCLCESSFREVLLGELFLRAKDCFSGLLKVLSLEWHWRKLACNFLLTLKSMESTSLKITNSSPVTILSVLPWHFLEKQGIRDCM